MARTSLAKIKQKYKETHPENPEWIEFTITDEPDATVYRIHHPLFQTNKERRAMASAQDSGDDTTFAKAMLGDDQYNQYEAEGGQIADLLLLIMDMQEHFTDTDDEGNPTRP